MQVRKACTSDAPTIASVMAAVAEEDLLATEPAVDVDERARTFRETIGGSRPAALWVLEDRGRVVG